MATKRDIALWVLRFSPLVILPAIFFALAPWLDDQSDAVETIASVGFAVLLLGYCVYLAARVNRTFDEVQIAGQRIAQRKA